MRVFLCGGGSGNQNILVNKKLNETIDHSMPCLYVPLAMKEEKYDDCFNWIRSELVNVALPYIEMVRNAKELYSKNFNDYGLIYIGGGNTFKLLHDIKLSGSFNKIKNYLENGGIVFGGSAGAIIFGADLKACALDDVNDVDLNEINGFDILNGISLLCHYTNGNPEKNERNTKYLLELSKERKVIALPEEVTLFVNDGSIEIIGDNPCYYIFDNGIVIKNDK